MIKRLTLCYELKIRKKQAFKGKHSFNESLTFQNPFSLCSLNISDAFDREYRMAYARLTKQEISRLRASDRPPNRTTMCCRKVFGPLEL